MIKEAINKLVNGEDLSYETVEKVMNEWGNTKWIN